MNQKGIKMNIYDVSLKDHVKIKSLFDEIIKRVDKDEWEHIYDLYSCLKSEIISHARAEEDTFHCFLVDKNNNVDPINWKCKEEHHVLALLILKLAEVNMNTEEWVVKFKNLHTHMLKHIEGEEEIIFPKAKLLFNHQQCEEMGINMLEMKEKLKIKTEQLLHEEQNLFPSSLNEKVKGE